jgi:hypothetical protein
VGGIISILGSTIHLAACILGKISQSNPGI